MKSQSPTEPNMLPPHELPPPDPNERPDGNNAQIHHPDDAAREHPVRPDDKARGPYVTGNY